MSRDADVIVVGGGPAGSATAYRLAREGLSVTLVDRARFPRDKPCAEYLSPEALAQLAELGVLGAVERAGGAALTGMTVRSPDGTTFGAHFGGRGVARRDLDALLLDHARSAGVRVVERFRVTSFHHEHTKARSTTGVVGTDSSGSVSCLRAALVIGSDGLRSVIARTIGVERRPWYPERYAVVAHFIDVAGVTDHVEMHVTPTGYVGIADVGLGRTSVSMVVPTGMIPSGRDALAPFLLGWLRSHAHLASRFALARIWQGPRATGPFAFQPRRVWSSGVALVGDAAGFFDPITGQGVGAALRGAALLAPLAAQAARAGDQPTADRALAAYGRVHARSFRSQWFVDELIAVAVANPWLMDRVAHAMSSKQQLADRLLGVTSGLRPTSDVLRPRFLYELLTP